VITKEEIKTAKENGINYDALKRRIGLGWNREIAITKPLRIYEHDTIQAEKKVIPS
jgi:hypothetical protein